MIWLRQSTASQEVLLGPFLDDTDGKTAETGLSIANTDIKIWKNGGTSESNKNSGGATHIAGGRYYAIFDATDTDTIGGGEINVHMSGALPVRREFTVLAAAVYDVLFGTTALSTYAGADTSGTTTLLSRIGSSLTITSGRVNADLTHIATAAVSTSTAQLGVNVVNFGGSAGTFASGRPAVNASYIGGVPVTATTSITFPSTCTVATTTGAVGSVTGAVGSVTGAVGSVTGAVGSVTGNVGGNVTGSVGSVVGAVGSVTGAVGSVTGNVGGNVTGSVGSIAANGIAAASFAADVDAEILSYLVDDATRIDASALNTASVTSIPAILSDTGTDGVLLSATAISAIWDAGNIDGYTYAGALAQVYDDAGAVRDGIVLAAGTIGATGNSTTTLHLTGLTYGDDEINDCLLVILDDSTGERHARWISDWADTGDIATVSTLPFTPENSVDTYVVLSVRRDVTGSGGLDAAGIRAAVGLASANLDTQLSAIDTVVDSILVDTGTTLQAELDGIQADTEDIQTRLPAALVGGKIDAVANVTQWLGTAVELSDNSKPVVGVYEIFDLNDSQYNRINVTSTGKVTAAEVTGDVGGNLLGKVLGGGSGTITGTGVRAVDASGDAIATAAELAKVPKSDGSVTWNATALASINTQCDTALSDVGLTTTITGRIDAAVSSRMATYTQPTGFLAATFPITVASTTNITAGTITTVTNLTNLPSIPANWLTAAGIAAGALNGKGDWITSLSGIATATNVTDARDAILTQGNSAWVTATGFATAANLATAQTSIDDLPTNAELATALAAADDAVLAAIGDIPTVAEFEARTLAAASYATAANQTTITTHLTDIKGATWASTDSLEAIRDRGDAAWVTATGFSTLTASDVRDAVGLASANLDTQLDALPTAAENATAWGSRVLGNSRTADMFLQGLTNLISFAADGLSATLYSTDDTTPLATFTATRLDTSVGGLRSIDPA